MMLFVMGCVPSPATFSADGKEIAFVTPGELESALLVYDAETSELKHRFTTDWVLLCPRYSPTEKKIAMIALPELSELTEEMEIWLYDAEKEKLDRLTSGPIDGASYFTLSPEYSPDGKQIAFMELDQGNYDIKRVEVSSGRRIRSLVATKAQEIMPRWSPDGKQVAYLSADPERPTRWYLHTITSDGKKDSVLFPQPVMIFPDEMQDLPTNFEFAPAWSSDGKQLAYCRVNHYFQVGETQPVITSRIHVLDLSTGKDVEIAKRSEPCGSIAWGSASDTQNEYAGLVFASGNSDQIDLYRVESPGVERRITSAAEGIGPKSFYPVWSTDGKTLVYRCGPTTNGVMRRWGFESRSEGWYPASGEECLFLATRSNDNRDHTAALYYADLAGLWFSFERAEEARLDGVKGEALRYYQQTIQRAPNSILARASRAFIESLGSSVEKGGKK